MYYVYYVAMCHVTVTTGVDYCRYVTNDEDLF